ncbi:MAG: pilus assembly protein N-terminal domain-containing protein [Planctomycetia bacterium]|nr:pilus assembly protein N-terminal domain-containing protein [Planctomycetia bacterium]
MISLDTRYATTLPALLRRAALGLSAWALALGVTHAQQPAAPPAEAPRSSITIATPSKPFSQLDLPPVTHQVSEAVDRIQMIVNTSRILSQESKIPQAQVNNPEIVGLTALSPNQVQIYGRRPGVTQVNIWDEKGSIRTIDVMVHGDAQELARLLHDTFPKAALRIRPISTGVIISGYVDDPNQQSRIVEISQNYYPNVINYITVGGVQQVLLQVRIMEVSRTKLRNLGVDLAAVMQSGSAFGSGAAGILTTTALSASNTIATSGRQTIPIRISSGGDNFYAFVEALKQNNLAKVLADPNLVTESGRPAFMNAGGEFPILVPQSLGTISVEYRRFGTQIDFVPIVMGSNIINLQVRPRISEIDDTRSVTINGQQVPGLTVREADTAVTLRAGQTLAIAGLVQTRTNSSTRGIPVLMDTPVIGSFFRRTSDQINEVELLIMVTPQIVEGIDPQQICDIGGGPGSQTTNPDDRQLFNRGNIEVLPDPCFRPPHFQREFAISPNGVSDVTIPPPGPPTGGEPLQAPIQDLTPPKPISTEDGTRPNGALIRPLPQNPPNPAFDDQNAAAQNRTQGFFVSAPRNNVDPMGTVVVRGNSAAPQNTPNPQGNSPTPQTLPPVQPENPSEMGLIGPIGYDVAK